VGLRLLVVGGAVVLEIEKGQYNAFVTRGYNDIIVAVRAPRSAEVGEKGEWDRAPPAPHLIINRC
jgi:hypothetical protein